MSRYRSNEEIRTPHPINNQSSNDSERGKNVATSAPFIPVHDSRTQSLDPRDPIQVRDRTYTLSESQIRTLTTVGAFRVIDARDLEPESPDARRGNLARLRDLGLIDVSNRQFRDGQRAALVTLTNEARTLLEHLPPRGGVHAQQEFYSGLAKPREAQHDAQLYRAYCDTVNELQVEGKRIQRVVLDYELKREYQRFLQDTNRGRPDSTGRPDRTPEEIAEWATEHHLPCQDGSVQFPDLRIEYEHPDGRLDREDLELTTEHYNARQMAGKRASGFSLVRGKSSTKRGGKPFDPKAAERSLR
jgi:hypothetical protein